MRVLQARVDWHDSFDNEPTLQVLVDAVPAHEDLRYRTKVHSIRPKPTTSYFAHLDGYVDYFHHVPSDEEGYGGRIFSGTTVDGKEFAVKGPWSSRAGAMNRYFTPNCVDVAITSNRKFWSGQEHDIFTGGAISLELALVAYKASGYWLVGVYDEHDIYYVPCMRRCLPKFGLAVDKRPRAVKRWFYMVPEEFKPEYTNLGTDIFDRIKDDIGYDSSLAVEFQEHWTKLRQASSLEVTT